MLLTYVHKPLFSLLLIGLFLSNSYAQTQSSNDSLRHSLGVSAGSASGVGFSYRFQTPKLGFEVTGVPLLMGSGTTFLSAGASLIYRIRSHEKLDVFAYYGNHLVLTQREMVLYHPPTGTYTTTKKNDIALSMALGAGVNIHLADFLDLSIKAGYGLYDYHRNPFTSIAGGVGLYYRF